MEVNPGIRVTVPVAQNRRVTRRPRSGNFLAVARIKHRPNVGSRVTVLALFSMKEPRKTVLIQILSDVENAMGTPVRPVNGLAKRLAIGTQIPAGEVTSNFPQQQLFRRDCG